MDYKRVRELEERILDNPMNILKEYLYSISKFHSSRTPFWKGKIGDWMFDGKTWEVVENLINELWVRDSILKERWLEFIPEKYEGRLRFYQSSGSTGKRKFVHWDEEWIGLLVKYLKRGLEDVYRFRVKHALVHGPYGWYQEEMSELIWSFGGKLYFIGIETDGLKKVLQEKGMEGIRELLTPLINYSLRVLEKDGQINTVRTTPQLAELLIPYRERIENLMISGTEVNIETIRRLKDLLPSTKLIPLYGHFLFGDCLGMVEERGLIYYPFYPFTIILPVKKEGGRFRIVKYGERGKLTIIVARPEIFFVTIEDEEIERVEKRKPFKYDGFSNPKRRL